MRTIYDDWWWVFERTALYLLGCQQNPTKWTGLTQSLQLDGHLPVVKNYKDAEDGFESLTSCCQAAFLVSISSQAEKVA